MLDRDHDTSISRDAFCEKHLPKRRTDRFDTGTLKRGALQALGYTSAEDCWVLPAAVFNLDWKEQ